MDFYVGQVIAEPSNSSPCNQLTIVEFDPLQIVAIDQMIEAGVSDQGQIIQLQDVEMFRGARSRSQLPNTLIGNEFTVRKAEGFEPRTTGAKDAQRTVGDQDALLQVHLLQEVAVTGQGREARVGELRDGSTLQGVQLGTASRQGQKALIG